VLLLLLVNVGGVVGGAILSLGDGRWGQTPLSLVALSVFLSASFLLLFLFFGLSRVVRVRDDVGRGWGGKEVREGTAFDLVGNARLCDDPKGFADALGLSVHLVAGDDLWGQLFRRVKDKELWVTDDLEGW
jgi:hypothetical protein